jgi:hypothetical protein
MEIYDFESSSFWNGIASYKMVSEFLSTPLQQGPWKTVKVLGIKTVGTVTAG